MSAGGGVVNELAIDGLGRAGVGLEDDRYFAGGGDELLGEAAVVVQSQGGAAIGAGQHPPPHPGRAWTASGDAGAHHGAELAGLAASKGVRGNDRPGADGLGGADGDREFARVAHGFDDGGIGAAGFQGGGLLGEDGQQAIGGHVPHGFEKVAEGADVPQDVALIAHGTAGSPGAGAV